MSIPQIIEKIKQWLEENPEAGPNRSRVIKALKLLEAVVELS